MMSLENVFKESRDIVGLRGRILYKAMFAYLVLAFLLLGIAPAFSQGPKPETKPEVVSKETVAALPVLEDTKKEREEKLTLDRNLVEYTKQLASYTGSLSTFTFCLVAVTVGLVVIGVWQGFQLQKSVRLAREEFLSTHRPRIRVRRVLVDKDRVSYTIANVGDTPAHITGGVVRLTFRPREFGPPSLQPVEGVKISGETLHAGGQLNFSLEDPETIAKFEFARPFPHENQSGTLYLYGAIKYTDDVGAIRETGFCRLFEREQFVRSDNPDLEYED
jgi:hypothetical protein